jgi:predicted dehydrogenase
VHAPPRLDDHYEIVAAVMSRNPERAPPRGRVASPRARLCRSWRAAGPGEPGADGIDVLAIMTPNDTHCDRARCPASLDVICDKPLAMISRTRSTWSNGRESGLVFCLTHNYTGYPMVRHAAPWCSAASSGRSASCM